jgi:hypothetical protein
MKINLKGLLLGVVLISNSGMVSAHGIAGDRYFQPTISVDDPYAAYEAHTGFGKSPNIGINNSSANLGMIGVGIEPFDGFGIAIDAIYRNPNNNLDTQLNGFDNVYYSIKKELAINEKHEYALTLGLNGQVAGTGSSGSNHFSTYTPTIFYAKGFGDLPNAMNLFKPFAVSGVLGYQIPTDPSQAKVLNWGFTLQYSFMYLNDHVRSTGWGEHFNNMIAVIEFPMQTCLSGICNGQILGSVNPGVIWVGKEFNLSAELVFPINSQSGQGTGFLLSIHKFLGR